MKNIISIFIVSFALVMSFHTTIQSQQVYGLSGFRPVYEADQNDLIGIRYRFKVLENESQSLRLIFGFHRFHLPGLTLNYIVETNVYSGRYSSYSDNTCTTWPLAGNYIEKESSLRLAIPDYAFYFAQQPGITTGIHSYNPLTFPVQAYNIDNIPNLYKADAISQFDVDNIEALVTLERSDITTDVSLFNRCDRPLIAGTYRKWKVRVEMPNKPAVECSFVLPDQGARYLTVTEAMNFASEFLNGSGNFIVQYWDFASIRESDPVWRSETNFLSSPMYDGNGSDFGIRVVNVNGDDRVEFSNLSGNTYIPRDTQFSITSPLTSTEDNSAFTISFKLYQNYPNPFNSATSISFTIPTLSFVSLIIYDLLGKEVAVIVSDVLSAGSYTKQWEASGISSGIYFYRLSVNSQIQTKKLILHK